MRQRSLAGPVILITIGALFLFNNLRPEWPVWHSFVRYWPFILIAVGVIRLAEVLVDAGRGKPLPARGSGAGWIVLVIVMGLLAWGAERRSHFARMAGWDSGRLELFGEQYDYPVSSKGSASGVSLIVLDNLRGNLTITGEDDAEYIVEGRKSVRSYSKSDAEKADRQTQLHVEREGNQLIFRAEEGNAGASRRISMDLDIKVPRGVSVEARGRSGDITVSSLVGTVDISSDRGDARLSDIGGNVKVDLNRSSLVRAIDLKGTFELTGRGNDVQLQNIAGQVTVNGSYSGTLDFKNLQKPLHFESSQTELRIQQLPGSLTMDLGDLRATNLVGPMRLRTKSRDVHIDEFTDALELELERGDIELTPGKPLAKMDVHSRHGNIDVTLPESTAFDLEATTAQGEVHNDYGPGLKMESEGRSGSLRSLNRRGPVLNLTTDRGTVTVGKS